jgi:hypothetical protein
MANGKNAGRLFADCTNEHGYGEYHSLPRRRRFHRNPKTARCIHCKTLFAWNRKLKTWEKVAE